MNTTSADIVVLTETWLTPDVTDSEIFPSHSIFRCDRHDRRGGGVLIATTGLSQQVEVHSDLEAVWVAFGCYHNAVLFGVCYRPPNCHSFVSRLYNMLSSIVARYPNRPIFLLGDFNYPNIDWTDIHNPIGNSSETNDFIDLCSTFNLQQVVTEPTRVTNNSASILDLVFTTSPDSVISTSYFDGLSDHRFIHIYLDISFSRIPSRRILTRNYALGDYSSLNSTLLDFYNTYHPTFCERSVEDNWILFRDKMHSLVDQFIPLLFINTNKRSPWYTHALQRLSNKKKRLYRRARSTNAPSNWSLYHSAARAYSVALKQAKQNFYRNTLPSMLKQNPRKFWSVICPRDDTSIQLSDPSGGIVPSDTCASVLNTYFSSVFTSDVGMTNPYVVNYTFPSMEEIIINPSGIVKLIDSLKLSSSSGLDNINSKILKNTKHVSSLILALLFTQSLSTGDIPTDWRLGKVIPIRKGGDCRLPSNYRPISLTSVCCKLLEHIIYSHISKFLDHHNFFSECQHGFRSGYSCETQLAFFTHDLHMNLDCNYQTDAIFLDFSKAFDKVPHILLLSKLRALNIRSDIINWITNFLSNRYQCVCANNSFSSFVPVTSGVPQGTVLGPLLFLIYINDLPVSLTSTIRLFADDCVVYRRIVSDADFNNLQADLDRIAYWCSRWLMPLNISKCSAMSFTRSRDVSTFCYSLFNTPLSRPHSHKYLGLHFTSDLSWSTHISHVISEANKSLGYIRRNLKHAPPHLRHLAFTTLVRPKLEYASSIWDPYQDYLIKNLEGVQNRATRFILSDYSFQTSVSALKNQVDLNDLVTRRRVSRLCLLHKLITHPSIHSQHLSPALYISSRLDHP